MSHRKGSELLIYYSCLKQFSWFSDHFGARLRLFHFISLCPHKVEKTESSNNRAQIVYNLIYQRLTEKGVNYWSAALVWNNFRDFLTFLERDSVVSTSCPHKVEKTESSNNRAIFVIYAIFVIFWLFWSETRSLVISFFNMSFGHPTPHFNSDSALRLFHHAIEMIDAFRIPNENIFTTLSIFSHITAVWVKIRLVISSYLTDQISLLKL